ncbi:MAG: hypothetical protein HGA37_08195 [Lentimicrobium sp.]|nr:hypothetical protein [Lentimicrobium sp.]
MNSSYTALEFYPESSRKSIHIGIIPDGGRRWATNHKVSVRESYLRTKQLLAEIVDKLYANGIFEISLYLSSKENFKRPDNEVMAFNSVSIDAISDEIFQIAISRKINVKVAGLKGNLPEKYQAKIEFIEKETCSFENARLNLCIAYNPIEEIQQAFQKADGPDDFINHLWIKNPVDLIVRTGGANLLSNFIPLQSAYARLFFVDKLFNDINWNDFESIIKTYRLLDRKYGT